MIAAAGNTGRDGKCWPGAFDEVTSVAALTQRLDRAAWSTRGDWVDCSTIGEGILSTYVVGEEDPLVDPDGPDTFCPPNPWAIWTGTSFAAPQVTGAVAQVAQREGIPPRDALARLLRYRRTEPGYGRVVPILPPT
jgi:subtilisin family serine protease